MRRNKRKVTADKVAFNYANMIAFAVREDVYNIVGTVKPILENTKVRGLNGDDHMMYEFEASTRRSNYEVCSIMHVKEYQFYEQPHYLEVSIYLLDENTQERIEKIGSAQVEKGPLLFIANSEQIEIDNHSQGLKEIIKNF